MAPPLTADDLAGLLAADSATLTNSSGQLATVLVAGRGVDASAASGSLDRGSTDPLPADASFRIASVTKTFTAASIYRLAEQGLLSTDDTLEAAGLPQDLLALLQSDGYDLEHITVAQVLNHSSGIFDYAFGPGSPYVEVVLADPAHVWTRAEQVAFAMEHGAPVGAPGEVGHYSDTGYVLLGAIIEARTGLPYGDAMAELLDFDELGLTHTYLETPGTTPTTPLAHQYFGDTDSTGWDASIDLYGGGGLVSTTHDLAVFFEALATGGVFDDAETFTAMSTVVGPDPSMAQGLFVTTDSDGSGLVCYGHEGFWGVSAHTCPGLGLTITRAWLQVSPAGWNPGALGAEVLATLEERG